MNYERINNLEPKLKELLKERFYNQLILDEGLDTPKKQKIYCIKLFKMLIMSNNERASYLINNELTKTEKLLIVALLKDTTIYHFIYLGVGTFYYHIMETK